MPEDIDLARPCTLCIKVGACVCQLHRVLTPVIDESHIVRGCE